MSRTSFATLLLLVAVAGAARADCADHAAEIQTLGEQLTQCTAVYGQNFPQTCPCYLPYTAKMHAIGCVDQASVDAVRKLCVNPSESFVAVAQKPAHREASPCSDPSVIDPIKKDLNSCTAIYGNNFPGERGFFFFFFFFWKPFIDNVPIHPATAATCPCYEPYVQSLFKLGCVDQASVDNVKKLCVGSGDSTATVEAPKCSDQAAIEAAGKKLTACTAIYGNNFPSEFCFAATQ
jgi:hypothetical protein